MSTIHNKTPISIKSFQINGNHRTSISFFEQEFSDSLNSATLESLYSELSRSTSRLQSFGLFDFIDSNIVIKELDDKSDAQVDVLIRLKEKKIPMLKVETFVKNSSTGNDVGCEINGVLRNPFGYGEVIKSVIGKNASGKDEFDFSISVPSINAAKTSLSANIKVFEEDLTTFSSFSKTIRAASLDFISKDRRHKLIAQSAWRDEIPFSPSSSYFAKAASERILLQLSPSTKYSLKYVFTHDQRDVPANPSSGSFVESAVELAVPPGTAHFVKLEHKAEVHLPIGKAIARLAQTLSHGAPRSLTPRGQASASERLEGGEGEGEGEVVLSLGGSAGLVRALGWSGSDRVHLSDRYFAGGPLNIRGFNISGVGPRSDRSDCPSVVDASASSISPNSTSSSVRDARPGDALGGVTKLTAFAVLSAPLPFRFSGSQAFRTFLFANAGSLSDQPVWPLASASANRLHDVVQQARCAVGCGLSFAMGPVRLEVTYAVPLRQSVVDQNKPFQIGAGLSFNA